MSFVVIRISVMSIIACDFNGIEGFEQTLVAILKNGCHGHQGTNLQWPNCDDPILFPRYLSTHLSNLVLVSQNE